MDAAPTLFLFGESDANGRRDILERRMIWVAHQVLLSASSVISRLRLLLSGWQTTPESTFPMSEADHDRYLKLCQPPSPAELSDAGLPEPPPGFATWLQWASDRWPTLPRLDRATP